MENVFAKFKETIDALLADLNGRAEELKENFSSFKDVFGKELRLQADNLEVYRNRLEAKGKKVFNAKEFVSDVREELEFAVKDIRSVVDRAFDTLKEKIETIK